MTFLLRTVEISTIQHYVPFFMYVTTALEADITVQDLVHEINEHYNKLLAQSCMLKV